MRRLLAARAVAALAALVVALGASAPAVAAACPKTSVAEIENEVMCPVCGTALGLAQDAPQADRQRAFIQERVDRCESKAEIKAALAREFGNEVLARPERRGFDLAAYLIPAVALAVASAAGIAATVRWRRRRRAAAAGATDFAAAAGGTPAPAAQARLERDLERYDL